MYDFSMDNKQSYFLYYFVVQQRNGNWSVLCATHCRMALAFATVHNIYKFCIRLSQAVILFQIFVCLRVFFLFIISVHSFFSHY